MRTIRCSGRLLGGRGGVCVCVGGGVVYVQGVSAQGAWEGVCPGDVCLGGVCLGGVSAKRGVCQTPSPCEKNYRQV